MSSSSEKLPRVNVAKVAIKAASVAAGAAYMFNVLGKVPVASDAIGAYRKGVTGLLRKIAGPNFDDQAMLDAGPTTLLDFAGVTVAVMVLGRLGGGEKIGQLKDSLMDLFRRNENQR